MKAKLGALLCAVGCLAALLGSKRGPGEPTAPLPRGVLVEASTPPIEVAFSRPRSIAASAAPAPGPLATSEMTPDESALNPQSAEDVAAEEAAFRWLYEGLDLDSLLVERDALEAEYLHVLEPGFEALLEAGQYEHVKNEGGAIIAAPSAHMIMEGMYRQPDGSYFRVVLSPRDHPYAYELRKKVTWINEIALERQGDDPHSTEHDHAH